MRTFKILGNAPVGPNPRASVIRALEAMGLEQLSIEHARALSGKEGRDTLIFRLTHREDAERVRRARKNLKGLGYAVVDELSTAEYAVFKLLQPAWAKAREERRRTWWVRERLFVDGSEVRPPSQGNAKGGSGAGGQPDRPGMPPPTDGPNKSGAGKGREGEREAGGAVAPTPRPERGGASRGRGGGAAAGRGWERGGRGGGK